MQEAQTGKLSVQDEGSEVHYDDMGSGRFSIVEDEDTLAFLNNQDTIKTYKSMQLKDGKLYPPMAAVIDGEQVPASQLGVWEQADEHPELIKAGNKFALNKGKGQGSVDAAYNPYMHSSNLVLNDQFTAAYKRNLVTVECEIPVSELTSGYKAQYAKNAVGMLSWHTGPVASKLPGDPRKVYLSRWLRPVRILADSEVAAMYKETLAGTNIKVPDNVVPASLLKALEDAGVPIDCSGIARKEGRGKKQSGKMSVQDSYDAEALYWARNNDIITNGQQRVLDEAIERVSRGYKGFPISWNGETIAESGDALMFFTGDYEKPTLTRVVKFAGSNSDIEYGKGEFVNGAQESSFAEEQSAKIIEIVLGKGSVDQREIRDYYSNGREDGRRKGGNVSRGNRTPSIRERIEAQGFKYDPATGEYANSDGWTYQEYIDSQPKEKRKIVYLGLSSQSREILSMNIQYWEEESNEQHTVDSSVKAARNVRISSTSILRFQQ